MEASLRAFVTERSAGLCEYCSRVLYCLTECATEPRMRGGLT